MPLGETFYRLQVDKYVPRGDGEGIRQVTVRRKDYRTKAEAVRAAKRAIRDGNHSAVVYVEARRPGGGSVNEGIAWAGTPFSEKKLRDE